MLVLIRVMIPQVYTLPRYYSNKPLNYTVTKQNQNIDKQTLCRCVCDLKYAHIQNVGHWIECYRNCKSVKSKLK